QLDVPVLGVIENMSYLELPDGTKMDVFGSGGGKVLADQAGVSFLGAVPIDPEVRISGDNGVPVVISRPNSVVAQALVRISEEIAAKISVAALKGATIGS
ncbi:MAG: P-loop NTPase, partial [Anaerolineales bacterium]